MKKVYNVTIELQGILGQNKTSGVQPLPFFP